MLNERLKNLRLAKGLTLQQVGDVFGISKVSVSTWESGKTSPDRKKLEKLAELFGISVQYLITGTEEESSTSSQTFRIPFFEWHKIKSGLNISKSNSWVVPIHSKPSDKAFATRYVSSSALVWQPTGIPAGSVLIVDPESAAGPGDFVIIEPSDKKIILSKLTVTPDNKKFLVSVESHTFKPIEPAELKVIGTVLEWQLTCKLK